MFISGILKPILYLEFEIRTHNYRNFPTDFRKYTNFLKFLWGNLNRVNHRGSFFHFVLIFDEFDIAHASFQAVGRRHAADIDRHGVAASL